MESSWNWLARRGDYVFVLAVYILLTILFTWPLAANFTTFVNGDKMDVFHELWYLHLGYTSRYGPFFILYTNMVFYPVGGPMYFQVMSPLHALIGMPIYYTLGEIAAYNFLYMFTFFASAFTMYIFVKYLTNNRYAAFFSAIVFGFASVHLAQGIAHLNIMASEMLPLFGYFFIKMVREQKLRNGLYAGVLIALNAMLDLHFLLLCFLIIASFLFYYVIFQRRDIWNRAYATRFFVMMFVAALIGMVVYYQTIYGLFFAPAGLGGSSVAAVAVHAARVPDLLEFFLPSPRNPFFGTYTSQYYANFIPGEQVNTYVGYSALAMSIIGLVSYRKSRAVWFWAFLAVVGFLLTLGPSVEVNGHITNIPTLWDLMVQIPFFNSFRTPFRIDYLVEFGVAVLSGYGIVAMTSRIGNAKLNRPLAKRAIKIGLVVVVCAILIIEYLPIPYPEMNATIPPFYTKVLANDHSSYAVLEVPGGTSDKVFLYYQSVYNRPIVSGHLSRTPGSSLLFMDQTPFINQLTTYIRGGPPPPSIINESISPARIAPYILAQYHIKYIIIHKDLLPPNVYSRVYNFTSSVFGSPFYEDDLVTVFRYMPPSPNFGLADYPQQNNVSLVSFLFGGWNRQGLIQQNTQIMTSNAGLDIYSATNQYVRIEFNARGLNASYGIQAQLNGAILGTFAVQNGVYSTFTTPFVYLQQGENMLDFTSLQGCHQVPVGSSSAKSICGSAQFSWIDLAPASSFTTEQQQQQLG